MTIPDYKKKDYEKCRHEGCDKAVNNASGFCLKHRTHQCPAFGCKALIGPFTKKCKRHLKERVVE